jgi:hypothetical protein
MRPDGSRLVGGLPALLALGFLPLAAVTLTIAVGLPVFHHIDELYHYDYCLKLARGKSAAPTDRVEPDLYLLGHHAVRESTLAYQAVDIQRPDGSVPAPMRGSYEAHHPPLSYWLNGLLLRLGALLGVGLEGGVVLLRLFSAGMVLASRWLLLLALMHFGRPVALAALPYLFFMVPVDLLRVSNDTPVVLLGALVFWLLARPIPPERAAWTAAAAAAALLASVAVKMNGLLYLMPAVLLCLVVPGRDSRFRARHLLLMFAPALLLASALAIANFTATGDPTGSSHLARGFPPASGLRLGELIPSVRGWLDWHELLLTIETQIGGRMGEALYPFPHLVSLVLVGRLVALGATVFGASSTRLARLSLTPERFALLRRYVWAGAISPFVLVLVMGGLWALVGRAYFGSARLHLPVEFLVVLPAAAGWAYLLAGASPAWRTARVACWIAASALFAAVTWPYLRFAIA